MYRDQVPDGTLGDMPLCDESLEGGDPDGVKLQGLELGACKLGEDERPGDNLGDGATSLEGCLGLEVRDDSIMKRGRKPNGGGDDRTGPAPGLQVSNARARIAPCAVQSEPLRALKERASGSCSSELPMELAASLAADSSSLDGSIARQEL